MKILVSACLLGMNCRYDGGNNRNEKVLALVDDNDIIPVCPECLGKLAAPRAPAEIVNGIVTDSEGRNVDSQFRKGAEEALKIALDNNVDYAILQSRSPSCGVKMIYDGTFTRTLIPGRGIFAQLLHENGIRTIDLEDL